MKHLTHDKGDLGVAMVQASLIGMGYSVFTPVSSSSPYDLVVLINSEFKTVQVKYVASVEGVLCSSPRRLNKSRVGDIGPASQSNYDFDLLAIYCPCTNLCYYVWRSDFKKSISLRLGTSRNNQVKNIKAANNYLRP